jgi:hypothetical protein
MSRALIALVLVAGGSPAARAQGTAWADKLFKGNISHDFGTVARGAQLTYRFPMTNIYAVDLEIVNVRSSCGCATVTPGTKLLRSKQASYIDVAMDARKFTGAKTITIYVTVGPEYTSTATLKVSAYSRADVVFNPGEVNFGVVARGKKVTQVIDVEYAGALPWRITEVVKNKAPLDVKLSELYRRPGQVGYRLYVTLKPTAAAGPLKQDLQLKTNDKVTPLLNVLVEGTVQAALTAAPAVVAMDSMVVGDAKTQRVIIRGNKPFRILAVEGLGDGVTAVLPANAAPVHYLSIKFQPAKPGRVEKVLTIKTDLDGGSATTVTLTAQVTE